MEKPTSSISNFKLFFINFLFPSLLAIGIFAFAFDYIFEKKIIFNCQTSGVYKIYRHHNFNIKSEIPIIGSSRAAGSYIPDLIDSNCYNYGIEKTEYRLIEIFLKNELAKNKTSPIIINFDYEIWANWIGDFSNYIPNLDDPEIKKLFASEDIWYYHVKGIRFFGFYQNYLKLYLSTKSDKNVINKGGFFLREKTPAAHLQEDIKMRKKFPAIYAHKKELEGGLINLLSSNKNRKIFIVVAPYHYSFIQSMKGETQANEYLEQLKKIPDVFVFDYSKAAYPDSLFKNTGHLNYIGAKRFSNELKKELHKNAPDYFN